jgi:hypothetical protein
MNAILVVVTNFCEGAWLWLRGKEFHDSCQKLAGKSENPKTDRIRPAVFLGLIVILIALFALIGGVAWLLFRTK